MRALALLALTLGCSGPTLEVLEGPAKGSAPASGFLGRQGPRLFLDGAPYRYLGFNAFGLTGCDGAVSDATLDAFFASLRPRSVVRTLAYQPLGVPAVERVVRAAGERGHKLILVLGDEQARCGEPPKTAAWFMTGHRTTYLPWLQTIARHFRSSTVIAMWEPVRSPTSVDNKSLGEFLDAIGAELHRVAPNHLVVSGTDGLWAYDSEMGFRAVNASPHVDVISFHDREMDTAASSTVALRATASLAKPVVLGEAGFFASPSGDPGFRRDGHGCLSYETRRDTFRVKLEALFATELAGATIAGWRPAPPDCTVDTAPGDPLVELVLTFPL